jgi:ADP-heptose:LPS heptosyltransferase
MMSYLKKLNRSKNYFLKSKKLSLKLKLITALAKRNRRGKTVSDTKEIKHIILPFIGKGIGDAIVIGGVIDLLVKSGYQVSVVADKRTYFLFEEHQNIHKLFFFDFNNKGKTINELKLYQNAYFVDSHEITHSSVETFDIIRKMNPARTIGFINKHKIYDILIDSYDDQEHLSHRYISLLSYFGLNIEGYDYSVHIPEKNKLEAAGFLSSYKDKHIIAFNPYGSVQERFFSNEQLTQLLGYFKSLDDVHVVVIGEQNKIKHIPDSTNITKNHFASFFTAAQIVKEADLIISPDTSVVHVARAFNKRIVCIYPYKLLGNGADNAVTWGPNYPLARQIRLKEKSIKDADIDSIIKQIDDEVRSFRLKD